ncbi:MAG: hypothetical protein ACXAC8_09115 [Candidatus Hodarchaeales archaeon]|jgi:hypothetical protein
MVTYLSIKDSFIRESPGVNPLFIQRISVSKKLAQEIFTYFKSLDKDSQRTVGFSYIKKNLNIPNYEGYEFFLDIRNGVIELKGEKIIVKEDK